MQIIVYEDQLSFGWKMHNFKIRKTEEEPQPEPGCNCTRAVGPCPLEGKFKQRYYGHRQSFKKRKLQDETTLSSHVWDLKDKNENFEIKWKVIDRASEFNPVTRKCRLCIQEKYYIIFQPDGASLNKRSELFSTCRHRKKRLLQNI